VPRSLSLLEYTSTSSKYAHLKTKSVSSLPFPQLSSLQQCQHVTPLQDIVELAVHRHTISMNVWSLHSSLHTRRPLYPSQRHILLVSQRAARRSPPSHKRTASHSIRSKPSRPAPPRPPNARPPATAQTGSKIADANTPNLNARAAQDAKAPFSWKRPLARLTRRSKVTVLVVVAALGLLELAWYSQVWARYRAGTTFEAREERRRQGQRERERERWRSDG